MKNYNSMHNYLLLNSSIKVSLLPTPPPPTQKKLQGYILFTNLCFVFPSSRLVSLLTSHFQPSPPNGLRVDAGFYLYLQVSRFQPWFHPPPPPHPRDYIYPTRSGVSVLASHAACSSPRQRVIAPPCSRNWCPPPPLPRPSSPLPVYTVLDLYPLVRLSRLVCPDAPVI